MKTLLRKLKTGSTFSFEQWKILGRAYFLLLKVHVLLIFLPLPSVEKSLAKSRLIRHLLPPPGSAGLSLCYGKELLNLFRIAWRYQWKRPNCLGTSLAKQLFLASYGYSTKVFIGVRKEKGQFQAHAWCEENSDFHSLEALGQ